MSAADIKPIMFSKRYWDGDDNGTPSWYRPNPSTGQVDISAMMAKAAATAAAPATA